MSKNKTKNIKIFSKVIIWVLIALIIIAGGGLIYFFTNGFSSDFKSFYVQLNNEMILNDTIITLVENESNRFDIKYIFKNDRTEKSGYSVAIIPNANNNFEFFINGFEQSYIWSGEYNYFKDLENLSDFITIEYFDDYFTLILSHNFGVINILQKRYNTTQIVADDLRNDLSYFTLVVTSYDNKANIFINLNAYIFPDEVKITSGGIIF